MLENYRPLVETEPPGRHVGFVSRVVGLTIECRGISVAIGDLCSVERIDDGPAVVAEVLGFRDGATVLMPLDDAVGLAPGSRVQPMAQRLSVHCGESLLGRVLDGLGRPIDEGPALRNTQPFEIQRPAPSPLSRATIDQPLVTGVSAIDGLLTLGRGQRMGIFAGSGVGKSTLLGSIARTSDADVNVIALIGERGREVKEFIEDVLGPEGLARSVVVVATSDSSPLQRFKGAFTAVTIAEYFRDRGANVMLMMDSVTRLANALREIGLALGEPPTVKGYPPSFFSTMPRLVERLGRTGNGSITGLLTVLVDADDMNEPVADTMRGLLDGHIVLSRKIASRNQYPAIEVLDSTSRVMRSVVSEDHDTVARTVREVMATYEDARDLIAAGAYRTGTDPKIDAAMSAWSAVMALLKQRPVESRGMQETTTRLQGVIQASRGAFEGS